MIIVLNRSESLRRERQFEKLGPVQTPNSAFSSAELMPLIQVLTKVNLISLDS